MSGIAGIWHLDGQPVARALLLTMTDALAQRGPDGAGHWFSGGVALGHRMLHTTPESLMEEQPLADETGALCLTWDGRVDNREELRRALLSEGARLRSETDAELVLRSYQAWGEQCPGRILGDFAFAVWDGPRRRLFCARDVLGLKPFYYSATPGRFLFASELRALLAHPEMPREANEGMVAEYLADRITDREETLYQGILRLPAAHSLIVEPGRISKNRYWDVDPERQVRHRGDDEYAEHFLEIFGEAVRCRLRSHGRVGTQLSGGIDSSAVVGMAERLRQQGEVGGTGLAAFSISFPGQACDESRYMDAVEAQWRLKANRYEYRGEPDGGYYEQDARTSLDFPQYPNGAMHAPLMRLAQEQGFRVMLTGTGGDEWFSGSLHHYADLLRRFRLVELAQRVRAENQVRRSGGAYRFATATVLNFGVRPLVPRGVRTVLSSMLGRNKRSRVPQWLESDFARRVSLEERLNAEPAGGPRFRSFVQAYLYQVAFAKGWYAHSLEMAERFAAGFGIELRHPLQDRRVLEFGLALPEEQRWRGTWTKYVLRRAMHGLLPESVRQRTDKGEYSLALLRALQEQERSGRMSELAVAEQGWVNEAEVRKMQGWMAQQYAGGQESYVRNVWPLWMVAGVDTWFRGALASQPILETEPARLATA